MTACSFLYPRNCEQHITASRQTLRSLSGYNDTPQTGQPDFPYIRLSTDTQYVTSGVMLNRKWCGLLPPGSTSTIRPRLSPFPCGGLCPSLSTTTTRLQL